MDMEPSTSQPRWKRPIWLCMKTKFESASRLLIAEELLGQFVEVFAPGLPFVAVFAREEDVVNAGLVEGGVGFFDLGEAVAFAAAAGDEEEFEAGVDGAGVGEGAVVGFGGVKVVGAAGEGGEGGEAFGVFE